MKKNYYLKNYYLFYLLCFNYYLYGKQNIKVLLDKIPIENNKSTFVFEFENVTKIYDYHDPENYHILNTNCALHYDKKKKSWFFNNRKLKIESIGLSSNKNTYLNFKNNEYEGEIIIKKDENNIYIINNIDLELYVASVVAKEFYAEWNEEALKTAAIIVRTYALYKIEEAQKTKHFFHIKNSIAHQKYDGLKRDRNICDAVNKTRGKIICYQEKPILAMYHICCGGVKPIECVGFDFKKCPYLKRKEECTGCKNYKSYFWKNNINRNTLCNNLSDLIKKDVIRIIKIQRTTYARSGTIRRLSIEIEIKNNKKKKERIMILLNNKDLRKLFNIQLSSYSSCFTVNFNDQFDVEINGRGHGHHIGLCQRGMHGYSKQGLSMEKIIEFYFPDTTIVNI
jgi:stage II sporulation protein D